MLHYFTTLTSCLVHLTRCALLISKVYADGVVVRDMDQVALIPQKLPSSFLSHTRPLTKASTGSKARLEKPNLLCELCVSPKPVAWSALLIKPAQLHPELEFSNLLVSSASSAAKPPSADVSKREDGGIGT